MKKTICISLLVLLLIAGSSIAQAAQVPSWIAPGLTLKYSMYSAFISDGQYKSPVTTTMTIKVDSASRSTVSTTRTISITPHIQVADQVYNDHYAIGKDDEKFWVDPSDPIASRKGPNGELMKIIGEGKFNCAGGDWDAVMMSYDNNGVEYHITYDKKSGLILALTEKHPSQFLTMTLNSIGTS